MSSSLFYSLREGLDGFRRAKLASFVALLTMTFALILLGVLSVVAVNVSGLVDAMRSRIEFEAFIDNGLDPTEIAALRRKILQVRGVAAAQFI